MTFYDVLDKIRLETSSTIDVELGLKDVLLLKDQYPETSPFIHYNHRKNIYRLKVQVNDLKPIDRFMRGIDGTHII